MESTNDCGAVPFARIAPPPLPFPSLAYTWIPDRAPRRLVRAGLFLGGLLLGMAFCTLSFVVLSNLGKGISVASVLARLISIALLLLPIAIGRIADRRLRTGAVLFGTLIPVPLAALVIVPNAILM